MAIRSLPQGYDPIGFQKLQVTSAAAVGFTLPGVTRGVWIGVEDAAVRVRMDGTDPATDTGLQVYKDDFLEIYNVMAISKFKVIAVSTTANLHIHYFSGG
jgi:hypothetical protein